jgi:plastocyanin
MNGTVRLTTILGRTLAALLLAGIPAATLAGPNLAGSFSNPPYAIAARCDHAQSIAYVNVVVVNRGDTPTAAIPVTATDGTNVLEGSTTLLPIAPGAQSAIGLPLRHVPSNVGAVAGTHLITVSLGSLRLGPLAVIIPPAFCGAATPGAANPGVSGSAAQRAANVVNSHPLAATPGPWTSVTASHPNMGKIIAATRTPAVPGHVHVSNGSQECAAHVGLLGALVCPDMIRSGNVLRVWDWQPGTVGPGNIEGFRVYRVDRGMKQLVYTRPNKNDLTLYDMPGPSGANIGQCYAVSAYAGSFESDPSGAVCLKRQNTLALAAPSVVPTPTPTPVPRHVMIHVTADSYPLDTVVAAGGDVTWINDDTDEHSVYGIGGSIVGDLQPNGGRFTNTFRDTGVNYVWTYTCEYHQDMRGRLTVLR